MPTRKPYHRGVMLKALHGNGFLPLLFFPHTHSLMFTHPHCRPLCLFILFFSQMPQCSVKNCLSFNMILPPLFHLFSLFSLLSASLLYSSLRQLLPSPLCDCVSFSLSFSLVLFLFLFRSLFLSLYLSFSLFVSLSPSKYNTDGGM